MNPPPMMLALFSTELQLNVLAPYGELVFQITDGRGTVYMVGRWHVTDEDMKVFGMVRHKMQMAVFFSVIDVSTSIK